MLPTGIFLIWNRCDEHKVVNMVSTFVKTSSIPAFRVSTTILNPEDVFSRQRKLNFEHMQGQVKSRQFSERIGVRRQYFHFLNKILGIIS